MSRLITDLAIMLLTAGVVAVIFRKFKQPIVLGYILAGFLVGPYMSYFFTVTDQESIDVWSEIGIIILMFSLGLEFNLHKLLSIGKTAVITALTEVLGMLVIGYLTGHVMGWSTMDSLFLGGMLSMSSTTIIIKTFDELEVQKKDFAQLVFGILVVEDIAGIFMMILLSTVAVGQNVSGSALMIRMLELAMYLFFWLILGIYLLPTILRKTALFFNDEIMILVSLGLCFGMVLLAEALGFSSALGAFLAGSLLAGTVHAERVEHLTSGIKDLFGAVFFLSVGMMISPQMIIQYMVPILIITIVTIVGKIAISALGVLLSGQNLKKAVRCGCSLGQIGEFAFIIAALGMSLGEIADYIYPIVVSVSVITTLTTPAFVKHADKLYAWIAKLLPDKMLTKLERYTTDNSEADQDSDWTQYMRRFVRRTVFFGILMIGVALFIGYGFYPVLETTELSVWVKKAITVLFTIAGEALFIRPMMDLHSSEFTALWVKNKQYHLPLVTLNGLRFMLIVMNVFIPVQRLLDIDSVWLLPVIVLTIILIYRTGWMASTYLSVETRFIANMNERSLENTGAEGPEWPDDELFVWVHESNAVLTVRSLKRFHVNVIQILRGSKQFNLPSGMFQIHKKDRLCLLGKKENLNSLSIRMDCPMGDDLMPLHQFIEQQTDEDMKLYTYVIPNDSELQGKTIKLSNLRDKYGCLILGLQRNRLPVLQPDVNMTLQAGDCIWVIGSKQMCHSEKDRNKDG
ncbi:MAG: cation:proton antiporter [Lachnospiraceae bacterium]|nr:cation:proton antiporter [Lachnospiraceae bacterium]